MNIQDPDTSRILAILIQPVKAEDRREFIKRAEAAPDMDSFIDSLGKGKN